MTRGCTQLKTMAEAQTTISEVVKRELQEAVSSGGVAKLKDLINKKNNEWKEIPLNIAITGESGVGKSSFINAIRGITADDDGGAHVDVVEATREIKPYTHPMNSSMVLWDLPGVGTPRFPRGSYLTQVNFEKYDFFLIVSAGRFREDDLWLAQEIQSLKKNFHFVRTQMDVEVDKDKKGHPKTHSKSKVIEKVRIDCLKNLEEHDLTKASVFLIDNYSPMDYDFDALTRTLIDEAPEHKREAMILSMSVLTDGVIERKLEALKERIYKVSLLSAVGGAIPIPGVGAAVDLAILAEEVNFYKSQLGLDAETIAEHARYLNTEARQLQKKLGLQSFGLATTAKGLAQSVSSLAASETVESTLPLAIPVIGSIISAGISYGVSVASLRYFLGILSEDARKINEELLKNSLQ
ncbi:interferon-inducible GTPase 5-like isoform X1 [Mercenaria mercenaria]|uniref:interferon-inducible GTPase 5-like isoform X1 n=2 Tax=Mercenaria mercenaria TaxID=6596 RepID=UPI00234E518A|nr:interferon-inducible GTPase 5-like isoform X1 [Mercenaria mercenaria]